MIIQYKEVTSFEEIATEARNEIPETAHRESYILAYEATRENIQRNPIEDVAEEAAYWASEERPQHLFFSHGEYRKGGLTHISDELKRKPTSNRALYSLINQEDISGSGDKTIPSFMVFQCLLEQASGTLNCTVYFRALEVSKFLRINLEEIRQNLIKIFENGVNYQRVKIMIVAGRAHHSPGQIPLHRPKIDVLTAIKIYKLLKENRTEFRRLLREKANTQSVVSYSCLEYLKEGLEDLDTLDPIIISDVDKAIELSKLLQSYREQDSHSERLAETNRELKDTLERLAERFDNE